MFNVMGVVFIGSLFLFLFSVIGSFAFSWPLDPYIHYKDCREGYTFTVVNRDDRVCLKILDQYPAERK